MATDDGQYPHRTANWSLIQKAAGEKWVTELQSLVQAGFTLHFDDVTNEMSVPCHKWTEKFLGSVQNTAVSPRPRDRLTKIISMYSRVIRAKLTNNKQIFMYHYYTLIQSYTLSKQILPFCRFTLLNSQHYTLTPPSLNKTCSGSHCMGRSWWKGACRNGLFFMVWIPSQSSRSRIYFAKWLTKLKGKSRHDVSSFVQLYYIIIGIKKKG